MVCIAALAALRAVPRRGRGGRTAKTCPGPTKTCPGPTKTCPGPTKAFSSFKKHHDPANSSLRAFTLHPPPRHRPFANGDGPCEAAEEEGFSFEQLERPATLLNLTIEENDRRLIVIGDVHGCADELELLLDKCRWNPADLVVFVGDLVRRGGGGHVGRRSWFCDGLLTGGLTACR